MTNRHLFKATFSWFCKNVPTTHSLKRLLKLLRSESLYFLNNGSGRNVRLSGYVHHYAQLSRSLEYVVVLSVMRVVSREVVDVVLSEKLFGVVVSDWKQNFVYKRTVCDGPNACVFVQHRLSFVLLRFFV